MPRLLRSLAVALFLTAALPSCTDGAATDTQDQTESSGRFELFVGDDGQHYFQLLAKNGERLLRSEGYSSLSGAKNGIASVKKNGATQARYVVLGADDGEAYFNLKAGNGQVIATSDVYTTAAAAQKGVTAVMKALVSPTSATAEASGPHFETFKGSDGKYYFHLRAGNGQVVLDSQGYSSKSSAQKGIDSVEANGVSATRYDLVAGADGQHTFTLRAGNGQVIGNGEMYASKSGAIAGAGRVRDLLRDLSGEGDVTDAEALAEIQKATEGVYYLSESDFPYTPVSASLAAGQTLTEALVREKFASFVDGDPAADKPLASLVGMSKTWDDWKSAGVGCWDPEDPAMVELCGKTRNLEQVLESNLTDLHVYYFGAKGTPGDVTGIAVSILIVGVTPEGQLAGVRTIAIWT